MRLAIIRFILAIFIAQISIPIGLATAGTLNAVDTIAICTPTGIVNVPISEIGSEPTTLTDQSSFDFSCPFCPQTEPGSAPLVFAKPTVAEIQRQSEPIRRFEKHQVYQSRNLHHFWTSRAPPPTA